MKTKIFALSVACLFSLAGVAKAPDKVIQVSEAKIFAPMAGMSMTAGYATIKNLTTKSIGVSFEKVEGFSEVEFHQTIKKDGQARMEQIAQAKIPPGGVLQLKQGGHHLMLYEGDKTIVPGHSVKVLIKVDGKTVSHNFKIVDRLHAH